MGTMFAEGRDFYSIHRWLAKECVADLVDETSSLELCNVAAFLDCSFNEAVTASCWTSPACVNETNVVNDDILVNIIESKLKSCRDLLTVGQASDAATPKEAKVENDELEDCSIAAPAPRLAPDFTPSFAPPATQTSAEIVCCQQPSADIDSLKQDSACGGVQTEVQSFLCDASRESVSHAEYVAADGRRILVSLMQMPFIPILT